MGLFLFLGEPILRELRFSATPLVFEVEFSVAEFDYHGAFVVHLACNNLLAQFVENESLQGTLDRTGTKLRVVSLAGYIIDSIVGYAQVHTVGEQHLVNRGNLQSDNVSNLLLVERLEHDDFIYTVQELGADGLSQHLHYLVAGGILVDTLLLVLSNELAAKVGSEDYQRILKVDRASFVVGESAVVQYLQEDIEDIGVRFLYLVEQDHAIWFASNGFGKLSSLVVAYISGRRTDEPSG